ncbi:hypothetical protein ACIBG8_36090 [Nonomuraea sp. NPDC050556]|uniref:hypothetical protein n=1 Tax=Nonomuraea sp. NPDC050556 TaxID=3364369 RepID=UPI0037AAD443
MSIDRRALVARHTIVVTEPDPESPLSVGNGEFAFTADVTGLQTFVPYGTQAQWGWHTMPNPEGHTLADALTDYDGVGYPDLHGGHAAGTWLHVNPQRLHLGRIALDPGDATPADLSGTRQTLDLWTGLLTSCFTVYGRPYTVETVCHPARDLLAVRVEGGAPVTLAFPYASDGWHTTADWDSPDRHTTLAEGRHLTRVLDDDRYHVTTEPAGERLGQHLFRFDGPEVVIAFDNREELPSFEEVKAASAEHWARFWSTGGAVELDGPPQAAELERRVVLSQYLTAIHCAGSTPPQETGLLQNSWGGKFHLEMHWWHAAHFALWGRADLLERSLGWYRGILPAARATAERQGYAGVRWPKQTSPDGRESPSPIGAFILWQQPHPIYLAELVRRVRPEALHDYSDLVFESAAFMASFPRREEGAYALGPPLVPAQESYWEDRARVVNPTFELAYWWWGLETAQRWRELLGLGRDEEWARVQDGLARPCVRDGVYAAIAAEPYTIRTDHPSMTGALGVVPPTPLIDPETMRATLHDVLDDWDLESTWGWDYPMLALCAARLGEPETAVRALLMDVPKNTYLVNGHNRQWPEYLPAYLPGNGGLLTAVAHLAAERCFPEGWTVRAEGVVSLP